MVGTSSRAALMTAGRVTFSCMSVFLQVSPACVIALIAVEYCSRCLPGVRSPGMASVSRTPFQRAVSVDGKPPSGMAAAGRRSAPCSMLVKQESMEAQRMMATSDNFSGNMGMCPQGTGQVTVIHYHSAPTVTIMAMCKRFCHVYF